MLTTSPRSEITLRLDAAPLRIHALVGASRTLILSFTSVGRVRTEWPRLEFISTASQGGENHVLFISDISRSWLNAPGMAQMIETTISDYVLENGITRIKAIGTSMGGFNALTFGRLLPLDCVVAFAPQFSVHPEVMPEEKRWWFFRKQITAWPFRDLSTLPGPTVGCFIFHGDSADEKMHADRFPHADHVHHFALPGADHTFVADLKAEGVLNRLVDLSLRNLVGEVDRLVTSLGGTRFHAQDSA